MALIVVRHLVLAVVKWQGEAPSFRLLVVRWWTFLWPTARRAVPVAGTMC